MNRYNSGSELRESSSIIKILRGINSPFSVKSFGTKFYSKIAFCQNTFLHLTDFCESLAKPQGTKFNVTVHLPNTLFTYCKRLINHLQFDLIQYFVMLYKYMYRRTSMAQTLMVCRQRTCFRVPRVQFIQKLSLDP